MTTENKRMLQRRGTKAQLPNAVDGEIYITTDTKEMYFGAGGAMNKVPTMADIASGGSSTEIANNLTTTTTGKVLDASQGKILNDDLGVHKNNIDIHITPAEKSKLNSIESEANKTVINNTLTSTSTTEVLSAYQGKVLKDLIDAGGGSGGGTVAVVDNLTSTSTTSALSANMGNTLNNNLTSLDNKITTHLEQSKRIINTDSDYPLTPRKAEGLGVISLTPHPMAKNPVISASDVTDGRGSVDFVADPFIIYENGLYYMFFEVYFESLGKISYATSVDGLNWEYKGLILDDTTVHYASPLVFKVDGQWYMLPDLGGSRNGLILYRATTFPSVWEEDTIMLNDSVHVDPCLILKDDTYYLITYDITSRVCNLYYANEFPSNNWTLHPSSPVWSGLNVRVGGRPIIYDGIYDIPVHDGTSNIYGEKLFIHRITELSRTDFKYTRIENPIIEATRNNKWNSKGMHHMDIALGQGNSLPIVAVDGANENHMWAIGIYTIGAPKNEDEEKSVEFYLSANQDIPAIYNWVDLNLNQIEVNNLIGFNTFNSTFTAPLDGFYNIRLEVTWITPYSALAGKPYQSNILMLKNDSVEIITSPSMIATPTVDGEIFRQKNITDKTYKLNKGDTLKFRVFQGSTETKTVQGGRVNTFGVIRKL